MEYPRLLLETEFIPHNPIDNAAGLRAPGCMDQIAAHHAAISRCALLLAESLHGFTTFAAWARRAANTLSVTLPGASHPRKN